MFMVGELLIMGVSLALYSENIGAVFIIFMIYV
jgi:hypothetical protein